MPDAINDTWSMDFMHDQLSDGKSYRLFNVINDYTRGHPGKHEAIRCDNEPEYISELLANWAETQDIQLEFIQPSNSQQNGYVERYNRTIRYDWLNQHIYENIEDVQNDATEFLWTYNNERPNMAIGGITLAQKLAMDLPMAA